jgi:tripartite-type tricarboxylate transporter receptor subunit TctC
MFEPEVYEEWSDIPTLEKLYGIKLITGELIAAPKRIPLPIRDKLVAAFSEAMKSSEFLTVVRQQELILPQALVGEDLDKWLKSSFDFYGSLIKDLGFQKK